MKGRRRRRRKQIPALLKETRGYFKLKEEAVDHAVWRAPFGKSYGSVVRQMTQ